MKHIATLLGATCCGAFGHFDFQTGANSTQHVSTHRNTMAERTLLRPTML